ncbi:MAG: septum formation initiator family protein [Muribaculaceae bacterium]|nr:septum formation initiator family protein [Muribaculaceae bacterium]
MKETIKGIYQWCRRYISLTLVAIVAYVVFMLFFNENSIMKSFELNDEIASLKAEIKDNTDSLMHYDTLLQRLNTDPETMERIVREYYHMQRDNEDVYIFE